MTMTCDIHMMANVRSAYSAGSGSPIGCDWPTHFGRIDWDLQGTRSTEAWDRADFWREIFQERVHKSDLTRADELLMATMAAAVGLGKDVLPVDAIPGGVPEVSGSANRRACASLLAIEWTQAAEWLAGVECGAIDAKREARSAMAAAQQGDWGHAISWARRACAHTASYHQPSVWLTLLRTVIAAASH